MLWRWRQGDPAPGALTYVFAPFAGGSAYAFADWPQHLLQSGDTAIALQYPGRGPRHAEPGALSLTALCNEAEASLAGVVDGPVVLVGHSLGAMLAYELASRLLESNCPVALLAVSSAIPPGGQRQLARRAAADPSVWTNMVRSFLGDVPADLEQEVVAAAVPVLQADAQMLDLHRPTMSVLSAPVLAMGGDRDVLVPADVLHGWRRFTTGRFACEMMPGDHFYYREQIDRVSVLIRRHLTDDLPPRDGIDD